MDGDKVSNFARAEAAREAQRVEDDMQATVVAEQKGSGDANQGEADKEGSGTEVERVRIEGMVQLELARLATLRKAVQDKHLAVAPDVATFFPDQTDNVQKLVDNLATLSAGAEAHLEGIKAKLSAHREELKKATTNKQLNSIKTSLKLTSAESAKGPTKLFNAEMSAFGRAKGAQKRSVEADARKEALDSGRKKQKPAEIAAASPTWTALTTAFETLHVPDEGDSIDEFNLASSIHEGKLGFRAAKNVSKTRDVLQMLGKTPYYKTLAKNVTDHLNSGVTSSAANCTQEAKLKGLVTKLKKEFDVAAFSTLSTPKLPWAQLLWNIQCFGAEERDCYVGVNHMATCECRILVSGEQIIFGQKAASVSGETLREKRMNLYQTTAEAFCVLSKDPSCFVTKLSKGDLYVIPSGFICVVATLERAIGLRWSVSGDDNDTHRVSIMVDAALEAFPELKAPAKGWCHWKDFLKSSA